MRSAIPEVRPFLGQGSLIDTPKVSTKPNPGVSSYRLYLKIISEQINNCGPFQRCRANGATKAPLVPRQSGPQPLP
jgi:hypothetical protein